MGAIKDRNGMGLTEAENIKKRWQEYTEELCKKDLHDPDNHNGVITHTRLGPDKVYMHFLNVNKCNIIMHLKVYISLKGYRPFQHSLFSMFSFIKISFLI